MSEDTDGAALEAAIKKAGSSKALAAAIGVTPQALSQWKRVPPMRVLEVERATGISRSKLRRDIYPEQSLASAESAA